MTTREEIEGDIRELKGEIRQLNTEIGVLVDQRSKANEELKVSLGAEISEKTALMTAKTGLLTSENNKLTALITSQQGNFSSRSSIVLFPIFSI